MKTTFTSIMKNFWIIGLMSIGMCCLSSCDEDEQIGSYVSGRWFGDMDMWLGEERALGSEIEFYPEGWGSTQGRGIEVDYYHRGSIRHDFRWRIRDGVIYMTFDDSDLDCAIADYRIDEYYFRGYIADYYTLGNQTYFNLRNYDRYWNEYGYSNYYNGGGYYYVKGEKNWGIGNDSTAIPTETEEPKCIRGVNKVKE